PVGSGNGSLPFDSYRQSRGAFVELQVPLAKGLEVNGALRYDSYSAVRNSRNFDANLKPIASATQGEPASKATYKLAFRFQPLQQVLLRGSVGTGFRAPSMDDITLPLIDAGVVGNQYGCPISSPDPLAVGCRSIPTQYKQQSGGNPFAGSAGLKPELSNQWTFGFRIEPTNQVSLGADLWSVKIQDGITSVPEFTAFSKFSTYRSLFNITTESATGRPILTFNSVPFNASVIQSKGLDLDVTLNSKLPFGSLNTSVVLTYLFDSFYDLGFGDGKETSLGKYGSDGAVAFRTLARISSTLTTGSVANTLVFKYKPGYKDVAYSEDDSPVRLATATGGFGSFVEWSGLDVPAYYTFDWQGRYAFNKSLTLTAGLLNVFDKKPPLTLKLDGGNMVGFDPRYHDGRGRTFYLSAGYKF
ncbi:MAG: TonB-dependent receptor domain-containing protein, partial [Betaproteobacteria bacterium]